MSALEVLRLPDRRSFAEARRLQDELAASLGDEKRRLARLILLEHRPVYALGRSTRGKHLLGEAAALAERTGAEVVQADRGGSVTYHGPGQLTAYLLLNLKAWDLTIHAHLWNLEEAAIRALNRFGVTGYRLEHMTGVWCDATPGPAKVCAIGAGCSRWVTYHGLGLNVDLDLAPFGEIDPCGLGQRPVTSVAKLLRRAVAIDEAAAALVPAFEDLLGAQSVWTAAGSQARSGSRA